MDIALLSHMVQTEDQDYIDRVKGGDQASYAFLVDKYQYMAYTIALRIVRNEEEAQDAAQESFIKAYQQLHQFEGKSKFSTWLYTIIYRTSISWLRENRITTTSITEGITENYSPDHSTPQINQLQVKDEQYFVRQAIERLPQTEALLITLFYMNENTVKEIQHITGLTVSNIKIKLFRARKKLERELQFILKQDR